MKERLVSSLESITNTLAFVLRHPKESSMLAAPVLASLIPHFAHAFPQPPELYTNNPVVSLVQVSDYSTLIVTASQNGSSFPVQANLEANGDGVLQFPSDDPETPEREGLINGQDYVIRAQGAGLSDPVYLSAHPDGSLYHTHQAGGFHTDKQFSQGDTPTAVGEDTPNPRTHNPYPTPFNALVRIPLTEMAEQQSPETTVSVYTIKGELVHNYEQSGTIEWNGKNEAGQNMPSGTYIFKIEFEDTEIVETKKVSLVR